MKNFFPILLLCAGLLTACQDDTPPAPYGAIPSERQLRWHDMEYYAFVHFNMNTFSGAEWGHGEEPPDLFNPTQLDCRQWARIAKQAGMKGIVITAKHHDGFCLWDSQYTEHDVAASSWRDGRGDVLRDLAEACSEYGLKMGVYLSPWDQHSPVYGTDGYNEYFMKQLTEVLTNYGDIFEVWFDGAVGPEYKGKQPYDWDGYIATVREHQPGAVIFSDAGPDIRWVGNEKGFANPTNWCTLNRGDYYPGTPRYKELRSGNQNGTHWVPAEVDVSIRPGWYYHAEEDDQVKSGDHLELIYYRSVGRNGNLLLNLPVDRRGLVHENDSAALMELRRRLDATFTNNLAGHAEASASAVRGHSHRFAAVNLVDGDPETYWATDDGDTTGWLELRWPEAQTFNVVELEEYIPLGQRVEAVEVHAWQDGDWVAIGRATTIGNKRWVRVPATITDRLRIHITDAMACPVIREVGVYYRPHANQLLESEVE
jgi:alpha-L-fucosidase